MWYVFGLRDSSTGYTWISRLKPAGGLSYHRSHRGFSGSGAGARCSGSVGMPVWVWAEAQVFWCLWGLSKLGPNPGVRPKGHRPRRVRLGPGLKQGDGPQYRAYARWNNRWAFRDRPTAMAAGPAPKRGDHKRPFGIGGATGGRHTGHERDHPIQRHRHVNARGRAGRFHAPFDRGGTAAFGRDPDQ